MSRPEINLEFVVSITLLALCIARAADEDNVPLKKPIDMAELFDKNAMKDHYPIAWTEVNTKTIIDNDRLFKKYKECLTNEHPVSCPRMVMEFKKLIPEMIDTLCAKCLPIHIEKFKEAVEYICHRRRAEYDQVRREKDPDGAIQKKFEEQFGKVNC
uniref:Chemosensory protein 3 n=1 Tax=Chouioia cunea TaxID=1570515 RepID=A0A6B9CJF3_9HYME|nr:chemosensory protein 3 [Chouioia cunea]